MYIFIKRKQKEEKGNENQLILQRSELTRRKQSSHQVWFETVQDFELFRYVYIYIHTYEDMYIYLYIPYVQENNSALYRERKSRRLAKLPRKKSPFAKQK